MMFGLKESTVGKIRDCLAAVPNITKAEIYGSRAKGNYQNYSDIDIALWGDLEWRDITHIRAELEDLPTLYKFDVLHYETLEHQTLKDHIDRVGKVLYMRETGLS